MSESKSRGATLEDLRRMGRIIEGPKRPEDDPRVRMAKEQRAFTRRRRFMRRFVPIATAASLVLGFAGGTVTESQTHAVENLGIPNEGDIAQKQIYQARIWSSGTIGSTNKESAEITLEELKSQGFNIEGMSGFLTYGEPYMVNKRFRKSADEIADMLGLSGETRHFWNFHIGRGHFGLYFSPSAVTAPDGQPYYFRLDQAALSLPPQVETAK